MHGRVPTLTSRNRDAVLSTALLLAAVMLFGQSLLTAEYEATPADLGIPGITKWYSVALIKEAFFLCA
jgi:hypothetical protein